MKAMQVTKQSDLPDVLVQESESGVVWITINRSHKHNALARPVLAAIATAVSGKSRNRSGSGSPMSALIEWALGAAARGLQTGARVLAGVLLALGALWPIWRIERRKGISQVSVRPACDDIAAVTGR